MKINFKNLLPIFIIVFSFFVSLEAKALTCQTDVMYNGVFCSSADLKSWNKGIATAAGCNVETVCPANPTNGTYANNCTTNTCVLSCTTGYTPCGSVCTPTISPTGNCSTYDTCNNRCSACNSGYSFCSTNYTCVATQTCLPGQTFNACTNTCTGSAAILKLGADSVSGTNIIQSASASYSTLFIPQLNRVGIGTSTPSTFLQFGGSGQTINMSGTRIGGLDLTPLTADEAVPLGYLQANYAPVSSAFWTGTSTGHIYNTNTGNIGIGTTNPTAKLYLNGSGVTTGIINQIYSNSITTGSLLNLTHASSTFSGAGLFMNFQSATGTSTANFLDLRINNYQRLAINYRGGLIGSYSAASNGTEASGSIHNLSYINNHNSSRSYSTLTVNGGAVAISNSTGGTDELMDNNYEGFKINSGNNPNMSGLYIQLKIGANTPASSGAYLTARLYTDNGGQPGTYLGASSAVYVRRLGVTYANTYFSYTVGLSQNTNYWVLLYKAGFNVTDQVYINTRTSGGTDWAEGNGTSWSVTTGKGPIFGVYTYSPKGISASSVATEGGVFSSVFGNAISVSSTNGSAISGISVHGLGASFSSGAGISNTVNGPSANAISNSTTVQSSGTRYQDSMNNTGFNGTALDLNISSHVYTTYYYYHNGTDFTDYTNAARQTNGSAYPLLADNNDHFYFGRSAANSYYRNIFINFSGTPNVSGVNWEYGSGVDGSGNCTWTTFTPSIDETNGLSRSGMVSTGGTSLTQCKVNGVNQYWMRVSADTVTTPANAVSSGFGYFSGNFAVFTGTNLTRFQINNAGSVFSSNPIYPGTVDSEDAIQTSRYLYDLGTTPFAGLGINTGLYVNGSVGIGSTSPAAKLAVSGGTGIVLNVGGGRISGLDLTPLAVNDAVPLGYLQANYSSTANSLWGGTLGGNIWSANTGNVGIGTTNPNVKLTVGGNIQILNTSVWGATSTTIGSLQWQSTVRNEPASFANIEAVTDSTYYYKGHLVFKTNDSDGSNPVSPPTEKMRILGNGNVGIGTTTPSSKLHINGETKIASGNLSLDEGRAVVWRLGASDTGWSTGSIDTTGYKMTLKGHTGFNFITNQGNSPINAMSLSMGGNVGIGTTNPGAKLHVGGGTYGPGSNLGNNLLQLDSSSGTAYLTIGNADGANSHSYIGASASNLYIGRVTDAGATTERLRIGAAGDFTFNSGQMFIQSSTGNVGIGTTTPTSRLSVIPDGGSTSDVVNIFGGAVGGLDLTPLNPDQAVPLGYLQANYLDKNTSGVAKFIGYTVSKYDGNDAGSFTNANAYCNSQYAGSHVCTIDEIFNTINRGLASTITASSTEPAAWVNSGPPGYTANVNDCLGWTNNAAGTYGTVWYKADTVSDGYGSLGLCGNSYKYACCK